MTEDFANQVLELSEEVMDSIPTWDGEKALSKTEKPLPAMKTAVGQYATAMQVVNPRKITAVTSRVLQEAKLAGDQFYYGWSVKTKQGMRRIEGATIGLAMCIARNFGNCALDVGIDSETPTHWVIKGVFVDLETGYTLPRLYRQRKTQSMGMDDQDRQEDIVFQIGQSKALRNAVLQAMPTWLTTQAVSAAKKAVRDGIGGNLKVSIADAISYFQENYGVSVERIERALGGKSADMWTAEDIVNLKGMASALKEHRVSAAELFPMENKIETHGGEVSHLAEETQKKQTSHRQEETHEEEASQEPQETHEGEASHFVQETQSQKASQNLKETHGREATQGVQETHEKQAPPTSAQTQHKQEMSTEDWKALYSRRKGSGFKVWVLENAQLVSTAPVAIQLDVVQKWNRFYEEPFPSGIVSEAVYKPKSAPAEPRQETPMPSPTAPAYNGVNTTKDNDISSEKFLVECPLTGEMHDVAVDCGFCEDRTRCDHWKNWKQSQQA